MSFEPRGEETADARRHAARLDGDDRCDRRAAGARPVVREPPTSQDRFPRGEAQSLSYIGIAILFGVVFGLIGGWDFGAEYFAGYVVENLSLILAFIGVKLVLHFEHLQNEEIPEIATTTSFVVILVVLTVTVIMSPRKSRKDPDP